MTRYRLPKNLGGTVCEGTDDDLYADDCVRVSVGDGWMLLPKSMLTKLAPEPPKYGDRVRVKCSATGRYVTRGLALVVSAMDNSLFVDYVDPDGDPPHPSLPVPSDEALAGALAVIGSTKVEVIRS